MQAVQCLVEPREQAPARRLEVISEHFPPQLAGEGQGEGPERSDQRRRTARTWRTAVDRLIDRPGGNLDRWTDDQEAPARGDRRKRGDRRPQAGRPSGATGEQEVHVLPDGGRNLDQLAGRELQTI